MFIGVISDTHNNIKNIDKIISLFNKEKVDLVIHTGDVTKAETLRKFSLLNCPLAGVFGNNDRSEVGLKEVCEENNFQFQEPPLSLKLDTLRVVVFHEPDLINEYIKNHKDVDIILHGHTHRYREETIKETIYFNPGESAGFLEGKSALGLIDTKNLSIRRIFF
tara:strand:- start:1039 stop:1530 length:492 start_codon:yes stop_codon:yes gene_type:complete